MKQHRIKNYLKLGFLLFGVSLLVVNCQKDDSEAIDELVVEKSPFQVNQVSIDDVPALKGLFKKSGKSTLSRTTELSCGTIDLDNILQVTHLEDENTNYSFYLSHQTEENTTALYNYVITDNDDGTFGELIFEYIPDETFLSLYTKFTPEAITNFTGQLNIYPYADFCNSSSSKSSSTATPCPNSGGVISGNSSGGPDTSGNNNGNEGSDDTGGGNSGGGGGSICNAVLSTYLSCGFANPPHNSSCYTTVISGWECHAVPIANTDGSNNSSATSRTVGGLDCENIDFAGIAPYEALRNINECLGGSLSDDDIEWLSDAENADSTNAISTYIDTNGCSDENQNFVESAIEAVMEVGMAEYSSNDYPGMDDGLPFEWWNDEEFVENNFSFNLAGEGFGDLTTQEKWLVAAFPARALIIYNNKELAETETINRFGNNGRNDKSDAFRHAFFNAMNSNDAGDTVARLFSNAHESEVTSNLILEVQMDLHNNNVGHTIGDDASIFVSDQDLSSSIYQSLLNGLLVYLSPLDAVLPPNFGINSSTQIIPTN